ncbi:hypothetical protein [Sinorhizobium medicae]|uniref:hypothetical protein n=1 Tax=Sinorhizobium medicae TaxID=110321 RepID=UPI000FD7AAFE|nr:hypothetical protein [Sinorhizobium medicae]RVP50018.1 hypothetical protein CN078_21505 [Sinorhizobium medicae]RVP74863.1 hypothetical protein CN079_21045 [Sinorhizobium medicae]UWU09406.1 hypothetical protein N2598_06605 [Sinorhizobium medicae]
MQSQTSPSEDRPISKLYGWLAGLLAILAVIGVVYGKGRLDAKHANEVRQLKENVELAQRIIDVERDARKADAILATEAAKRQSSLKLKITGLESYVETLQDRDSQCLSGPDVDRLRDLWSAD